MAGKTKLARDLTPILLCLSLLASFGINAENYSDKSIKIAEIDNAPTVSVKPGNISTFDGIKWNALLDKDSDIPRMIYGGLSKGLGEPLEIAGDFLASNREVFGFIDPGKELHLVTQKTSPGSTHVIYRQYLNDIPVFDSLVGVHIDNSGIIELVTNGYNDLEEKTPQIIEKVLSAGDAKAIAEKILGPAKKDKIKTQMGLIRNRDGFSRVWRIYYPTQKQSSDWLIDIDVYTGDVHRIISANKFLSGTGYIHAPNPMISPQRVPMTLTNLLAPPPEGTIQLTSLYFDVTNSLCERAKEAIPVFDYKYEFDERIADETPGSDNRYEEVMAYFFMESFRSYTRTLGFQFFGSYKISADAHGSGSDLSWYSQEEGSITFGDGGVNDASDADIIIHELGHAVVDYVKPTIFYDTGETAAMHEGYADYLAASFNGDPCISEWDSHVNNMECLRKTDNGKHYPEDLKGPSHSVGEIWSGMLWDLRSALLQREGEKGGGIADKIALKSIYYLPDSKPAFKEGAIALQIAGANVYNGRYNDIIKQVLKERGLL